MKQQTIAALAALVLIGCQDQQNTPVETFAEPENAGQTDTPAPGRGEPQPAETWARLTIRNDWNYMAAPRDSFTIRMTAPWESAAIEMMDPLDENPLVLRMARPTIVELDCPASYEIKIVKDWRYQIQGTLFIKINEFTAELDLACGQEAYCVIRNDAPYHEGCEIEQSNSDTEVMEYTRCPMLCRTGPL